MKIYPKYYINFKEYGMLLNFQNYNQIMFYNQRNINICNELCKKGILQKYKDGFKLYISREKLIVIFKCYENLYSTQ